MGHLKFFVLFLIVVAVSDPFGMRQSVALDAIDKPNTVIASPNGKITFRLLIGDDDVLRYDILARSGPIIEPSRIGILINDANLGEGAKVTTVERYDIDETFPCRLNHSTAYNHCRGAKFTLVDGQSQSHYVLEARAFDNGVAFRHIVAGSGLRAPDAATDFTIPAGSRIWHHDLRGHYEGVHANEPIESVSANDWIAPPLTIKLPNDAGYAAITEASLVNYAGMALQAGDNRVVRERLGHSQPVGRPFELRFSKDEAERLSHAAAFDGEIVTPWRVVMIGKDLNAIVNCDIVQSLSPPPDKQLFSNGVETTWIKPGRCVWKFLDGGDNNLESMKEFSRYASELGFEYNLIEGFWQRWSKGDLVSLVDYSRKRNVGIWLWKDSRALRTPESREQFFGLCEEVGVSGVKIDFLDHEAKEVVDLYHELLKGAARHHLMVNFHGANKPSGETRTWPNELTREAVRGLEARQIKFRSRHNATLPFTRYLAGPADYTPVVFGPRRGDTTVAHQIASAAIFTSPLLVYGGHPKSLLDHPAVEMIKSIPSVWDETIVLPPSAIGEVAAFARRRGDDWFVAVLGGPKSHKFSIPLSFLDSSPYHAMLVRDTPGEPTQVAIENVEMISTSSLEIELSEGGGFIARLSPLVARVSTFGGAQE